MLRYKYDDLYLHIAGTDEKGYINVLRNLMGKLNLQDRVVFLGHMDDMEKFYRSIDVLVAPSVVKESFGLVLCEAIYCGLPVIATNSGAQREIITKNQYGTIIDNLNADSLAEAISETDKNKERICIKGENYISRNFNIEITAKKLIEVYECL